MKVCWAGSFDPEFERNRRLREYLEAAGIDYSVVRVDLWPSDRVEAFGQRRLAVILRMVVAYPQLIARLFKAPTPDLYLVSYPGWFDVPIVKTVAWLRKRPIVFDIFISLYDTAISDRGLADPTSAAARLSKVMDRLSIRLSQRVIADCPAHARFLAHLAGVSADRFGIVYIGADEIVFNSTTTIEEQGDVILFYGTFVPLQGVQWIVRCAAIPEMSRYQFRVIGSGQDEDSTRALAKGLGTTNVQFVDPMPKSNLSEEMAKASLCLGIFGTSPKANRVIPHKVFEAIACGRPVLTGATEAILETFEAGEIAVCGVGDPKSLADSVKRLMENDRDRLILARRGRARFENDFTVDPQSQRFKAELAKVVL